MVDDVDSVRPGTCSPPVSPPSSIGDNLYSFRNYVQHADALFPSYVDVVYLSMYPLLIAGLVRMVHHRSGRDRTSVIDAGIITSGIGLVVWVFVIAPLRPHRGPRRAGAPGVDLVPAR